MSDEKIDPRFRDLMDCESKDLDAGRITTRWHGIENKIDHGLSLIQDEAKVKALKRGLFASAHEGFGVIAEEVAELLEAIRSNDIKRIRAEAVQVSAAGLVLVATLALWDNVPEKIKEEIEQADINELSDLLTVCAIYVPSETIREWTLEERDAVEDWAGATHLAASDNDIEVPEMPECLARVLIKPKGERGGYPIKGE